MRVESWMLEFLVETQIFCVSQKGYDGGSVN